jgi:hypothetical protein
VEYGKREKRKIPDHCENQRHVVYDKLTGATFNVGCGRCEYCKAIKCYKLYKAIDWGINGLYRLGGYITFLTLTTAPEYTGDIMKAWHRFRMNLNQKQLTFEYAGTVERKSMRDHLHVLTNSWLDDEVIKDAWYRATWNTSYITKIKAVNMESKKKPSSYLSKYVTKADSERKRKVFFSRGFPRKPKSAKLDGQYAFMTIDDYRSIKGSLI